VTPLRRDSRADSSQISRQVIRSWVWETIGQRKRKCGRATSACVCVDNERGAHPRTNASNTCLPCVGGTGDYCHRLGFVNCSDYIVGSVFAVDPDPFAARPDSKRLGTFHYHGVPIWFVAPRACLRRGPDGLHLHEASAADTSSWTVLHRPRLYTTVDMGAGSSV
jgi:hypothetical protein